MDYGWMNYVYAHMQIDPRDLHQSPQSVLCMSLSLPLNRTYTMYKTRFDLLHMSHTNEYDDDVFVLREKQQ